MVDENNGYDDLFDDQLFRATLRSSARDSPRAGGPLSTSEMRAHTHYEALGLSADAVNAGIGDFGARRPYAPAPAPAQRPLPSGPYGAGARRPYAPAPAPRTPPNGPHIFQAGAGAWTWSDTSAN